MGKLYLILVAIMIFITVSLSGIFALPFPEGTQQPTTLEGYECCDTGSDDKCHVASGAPTVQWDQHTYHLLKSDVFMNNKDTFHLDSAPGSPPPRRGIKDERVFLNPSEFRDTDREPQCIGRGNYDRLYGEPVPGLTYGCYRIPNDMLIYLCRSDNPTGMCSGQVSPAQASFDVYIMDDWANRIPAVVSHCYRPPLGTLGEKKIKFRPSPEGQPNLQLRTFKFTVEKYPATWLSPFCKPAIYLYPEKKSEINVSVYPQGEMLLTIPPYPKTGWDVVVDPNGDIYNQNDKFDYLYYEASLPDQLISQPKEGFNMSYDERALFLTNLVTKLGLNEKETKQFVEYWVPILPKATYYFVGVVPQKTLHEISPLLISPKPKNLIRVTLYFKPLEQKISVKPPLILPVSRDGYTAVEWGGIYKRDKNHPFSCFM